MGQDLIALSCPPSSAPICQYPLPPVCPAVFSPFSFLFVFSYPYREFVFQSSHFVIPSPLSLKLLSFHISSILFFKSSYNPSVYRGLWAGASFAFTFPDWAYQTLLPLVTSSFVPELFALIIASGTLIKLKLRGCWGYWPVVQNTPTTEGVMFCGFVWRKQ